MSPEYSLCPQAPVYVHRVQLMFPECSLCPQSTVYVPRVQFMTTEYGIFPQIVVNLIILLCISLEYIIFSKMQFMTLDYTLCQNSQSTVYILRAQFMSLEYI